MDEFNLSYVGPREDVLALVPGDAVRILDVGCSTGALGEGLMRRNGARITGIEADPRMAEVARGRIDRVIVGDAEDPRIAERIGDARFDCIVFADVLEHMRDPWGALGRLAGFLGPGGCVVASIPNIRHHTTIRTLALRGDWPHRERGIHDRTHLRFFTLRTIRELFLGAGLEIEKILRNYRVVEAPHRANRYARFLALPFLREFLAFQYLVLARRA